MEDKEGPVEEGVKGAFVVLKRVGMMPEKREQQRRREEEKGRKGQLGWFCFHVHLWVRSECSFHDA